MRTAVYVDGFNLFHSLLEGKPGVKWLDLAAMASGALKPHNEICLVRYFTARVKAPAGDPICRPGRIFTCVPFRLEAL